MKRWRQLRHPFLSFALLTIAAALLVSCSDDEQGTVEKLFSAQGNELGVWELETHARTVLIENAEDGGNDVNGEACLLPDGSGNFLMGQDTGQGEGARQGWGIFSPDGELLDKILDPETGGEAETPEPFGCAFDNVDRLFVSDVGDGSFDASNGKLIVFFPPDYDAYCVLDAEIHVAGTVTIDGEGNVLVPETVPPGRVLQYSPPFPIDEAECETVPANKSVFLQDEDVLTPFSIAQAPNGGWYLSSVFLPTAIREYDAEGNFVRTIAEGEDIGNPAGLAVSSDGTIYYADLGLEAPEGELPGPAPGAGSVRKIAFDDSGNPLPPEIIGEGYDYPDAVAILEVEE